MLTKKDVLLALLKLEHSVFVHFDPRSSDVMVPTWLEKQTQVVLQVGYDLPQPIQQLKIDDAGMYGIFAFKGQLHQCFVGWERIFAIVGGDSNKGRIFSDSMPEELKKLLIETRDAPKPELANPQPSTPQPAGSNVVSLDAWKQRKAKRGG
jgi:stringent starvation protein B